jgi:ribonuclease T1
LIHSVFSDTLKSFVVVECWSTRRQPLVKRAWAFPCILALSAILGACNKNGSQNAAPEPGSSASAAAAQSGVAASGAPAASGAQEHGALVTVTKAQLPGEAAETLRLIKAGGPFPFGEDGVLFRNSAGLLPEHPRGYYHTYTVRTPGAAATDRGQRRIVCGGPRKKTNDCYYTEDYYASFKRVAE